MKMQVTLENSLEYRYFTFDSQNLRDGIKGSDTISGINLVIHRPGGWPLKWQVTLENSLEYTYSTFDS